MALSPLPINQLSLQRYPITSDKSLRPWNAADELLLEYIREDFFQASHDVNEITQRETGKKPQLIENSLLTEASLSLKKPLNCLIINDQFGALSSSLNQFSPVYWTDSYLSNHAIITNLRQNFHSNIKAKPLSFDYQYSDDDRMYCRANINMLFNLVLIRIPKHNSLLEFQLNQLKPWINANSKIIAAGMTKEIHNSTLKIFEAILGKTTTSLAKKKARLIFCQPENINKTSSTVNRYKLPDLQIDICGLPGVFSKDKLDLGTKVLLNYLPEIGKNEKVIDLGCGSGVIGAIIAKKYPKSRILMVDESQLALESAKLTFMENQLTNGDFIQTDVLQGVERSDFDHILCNPPFHQQNVQTLTIAKNMFKQSAQCLKPDGQLLVVANRHLQYQKLLKSYFNEVNPISRDKKFTVWQANFPKHRT